MGWFFTTRPARDPTVLRRHLQSLSRAFPLWIADNERFVIVERVRLPSGYDRKETAVLIELPSDYPLSPPGIGDSHVYVSPTLKFRGNALDDVHGYRQPGYATPGFGPWAWWCYRWIHWDPVRDDLVTFMEMFRGDLTNPRTT